jgi:hypothetical protein
MLKRKLKILETNQVREDYLQGARHIIIGALIADFDDVMIHVPIAHKNKAIYLGSLTEYQRLTGCKNVFLDDVVRQNERKNKVTFYLENNTVLHVRDFKRF